MRFSLFDRNVLDHQFNVLISFPRNMALTSSAKLIQRTLNLTPFQIRVQVILEPLKKHFT